MPKLPGLMYAFVTLTPFITRESQGHRLKPTPPLADLCSVTTILRLKTADCSNKYLSSIPDNVDSDIQVLLVANNVIRSLHSNNFHSCPNLQEINLTRNKVKVIPPDTFAGLHSLQILYLEENQLERIPSLALHDLSSLRILSLKGNPIRSLDETDFENLPNLEKLDLESCKLTSIRSEAFSMTTKLIEINLVANQLRDLPPAMEQFLPRSLAVLRIHKNPWTCDCSLRWLRRWVETPKEVEHGEGTNDIDLRSESINSEDEIQEMPKETFRVSWDFAVNTPICESPPLIKGVAWKYLSQEQFACPGRIVLTNTTVTVKERQNATLECFYSGDPQPKVTWKNHFMSAGGGANIVQIVNFNKPNAGVSTSAFHATPGDHFQTRHRYDHPRDGFPHTSSVLIIPLVQVNQSGDYTCIVENSAGRAEATFKLVVSPSDFTRGFNSSQSVAYQLDDSDIWKRESILGVTASIIIIIPVLVFAILLWLIKRRKRRQTGKRKNPFNKSLAVPLTEKNNEACGTDDDDSNDATSSPSIVKKLNGGTSSSHNNVTSRDLISTNRNINNNNNNDTSINRTQSSIVQDFELDVLATSSKEKLLQLSKKKLNKKISKKDGVPSDKRDKMNDSIERENFCRNKISLATMSERHPSNGSVLNSNSSRIFDKIPIENKAHSSRDTKDTNDKSELDTKPEMDSNSSAHRKRKLSINYVTSSTGDCGHIGDSLKYGTWSSQSSANNNSSYCHVFANFNSVPTFDLATIQHNSSKAGGHFIPEVSSLLTGNSHLIGPAPPLPDEFPNLNSKMDNHLNSPLTLEDEEGHRRRDALLDNHFHFNQTGSNYYYFQPQRAFEDQFSTSNQMGSPLYEHSNFLRDYNRHPCSSRDERTISRDKY